MKDSYGREINYIRISLTDRCNLRCVYCMPHGTQLVPREEILRRQEIVRVVRAAAGLGIRFVKVTGGEPLVRRCCDGLTKDLKEIPGIEKVTLTTNGILLREHLDTLKKAGIDAINISLDTTDPERYMKLTGGGDVSKVIDAIHASVEAGIRTKINAVVLGEDWEDVLLFARALPVDVRFIEMMPIGFGSGYSHSDNREVFCRIRERYPEIRRDPSPHGNGPAVYYRSPGWKGSVGFISAIHGKFCDSCNRLRLTSMGYLKTCLSYEDGTDLRAILRNEEIPEEERDGRLRDAIADAIARKPKAHCFDHPESITEKHLMASIGG